MKFEEKNSLKEIGYVAGFCAAYVVFTSCLFLILLLTKKSWLDENYLILPLITGIIALAGIFLKQVLK